VFFNSVHPTVYL